MTAIAGSPDSPTIRSPGTAVRLLFFLLAGVGAWLLLFYGFPPGASDRLPVLTVGLGLCLLSAARPERGILAFSFLFPCAGLLARIFHAGDPAAWPPILFAALAVGWCFRFIYDFDSAPDCSNLDRPLRLLLGVWVLATIVALARAETLWAAIHGLAGRAVDRSGISEGEAIKESLFSLAALAGGAAFLFVLRRAGRAVSERALAFAVAGVFVSATGAVLQKLSLLPAETRSFWRLTRRLGGGAADPNSLGLLCALVVVLAVSGGLSARPRILRGAILLAAAAGLVLSGSRSGLVLVAGSLVFFFGAARVSARLRGTALVLAALGIAALLLLRGSRGTVADRISETVNPAVPLEWRVSERPALWRAAWRLFREHPLEGGGMGSFQWRFPDLMVPENRRFPMRDNPGSGYVQALAETGLIGFAATLFFAAALTAAAWRRVRRAGEDPLRAGAGAAVAGFLAALAVGSHWLAPDVAFFFFLLASVAATPAPRPARRFAVVGSRLALAGYAVAAVAAVLSTGRPDEAFRYSPRIGFHELEAGPGGSFRWTRRRFALWIQPGESLRLCLGYFSPENRSVELVARSGPRTLYRRALSPGQVDALLLRGGTRPGAIVFTLSRAFVPKRLGVSSDRRELGIQSTLAER